MRFKGLLAVAALCASPVEAQTTSIASQDTKRSPAGQDLAAAHHNTGLSLAERRTMDAAAEDRSLHGGASDQPSRKTSAEGKPFPGELPTFSSRAVSLRRHVELDSGPDGMLSAWGGTYKASFDVQGASFVPDFGSGAQQNYPLTFAAPRVRLAGEELPVDGGAAPFWKGNSATYDRGALVELYTVRAGELEQLFVFDSLPVRGDLTLRLPFTTQLLVSEGEDRLWFENDLGRVSYTHAIAIDGMGEWIDVPTSLVDGEIVLRVPAAFVETAAMPLTIDPVLSSLAITGNTNFDARYPDIAFDNATSRWLVVWERTFSATDHDILAETYDPSGNAIAASLAFIDSSIGDWRLPSVANNRQASQFLVVAQKAGSASEIWGRTRQAADTTMGPQFKISADFRDCTNADVGGNPANFGSAYYCVVWERTFNLAVDHDIQGRLVRADSVLPFGLISIDISAATYDKVPSISNSNGKHLPIGAQRWNVVWQRQSSPSNWNILGRQVLLDGQLAGSTFIVDASPEDDRWPSASSLLDPNTTAPSNIDRQWMAVYERRDSVGANDIMGTSLRGSQIGDVVNLTDAFNSGGSLDQILPSVDSDGRQFAVSWARRFTAGSADFDVFIGSVYLAGDDIEVSERPVRIASGAAYEGNCRVAASHAPGLSGLLVGVVWHDAGFGAIKYSVEGTGYVCPNHYGPFIGDNYCGPAALNSASVSAIINASGSAVAGGEPLTLTASNLPNNQFGFFLASPAVGSSMPPTSQGSFCIGSPISRFIAPSQIKNSGTDGRFELEIDTLAFPLATGGTAVLAAGQLMHFQAWFRDFGGSNLTDATAVTFH